MRVVAYLWLFVAVACGGRTLDESLYDEGSAPSGFGGAVNGGGKAVTGGARGGVTSGGSVGSGGAATTLPESCRRFCKQLVPQCALALQLDDTVCRSSCERDFATRSSTCESLRIAALACVENALMKPGTNCNDVSRILTQDCLVQLALSATCGR